MQKTIEKLQWKTKHNSDFSKEIDFLQTVLIDNGVKEEDIQSFLRPLKKHTHNPFDMNNMDKAVRLVHDTLKNNKRIFVKVDPDVDGFTSASVLI